ncbi:MAG: hypothetical protein AB1393_14650 [Candidatus Edwardsbacteria bacterium]
MNNLDNNENPQNRHWWDWLIYGPFTPFFRAHGSRTLSNRESIGLIFIAVLVLILGALGIAGVL